MTVSPNRPTDGSRPLQGGNGPQQNGLELPPVLFRLPNLGASAASRASKPSMAVAGQQTPLPNQVVYEAVAVESVAAGQAMHAEPMPTQAVDSGSIRASIEPQRSSTASHSTVTPTPVAASVRSDDRPAGRTWAEAAVAHRNVLMMLAIVVAVALWTSRRSPETTEIERTLAREGIAMDAGVAGIETGTGEEFSVSMGEPAIDPPKTSLPASSAVAATPSSNAGDKNSSAPSNVASAMKSSALESLSSPINAPEIRAAAKSTTSNNVAQQTAPTAPAAGKVGGGFDEASLSATTFASAENTMNSASARLSDKTFGGRTPATVVANRRPSDTAGLPSLDDLESEPALSVDAFAGGYGTPASSQSASATGASLGTPTVAAPPSASSMPIPSSTPNGVVDWLKYAPEYPSAR